MPFTPNEIISNLTGGGVHPGFFDIQVNNPIDPSGDSKLTFTAKAASLPPTTLGTIEVPYWGRKVKFAGDATYEPWIVTIFNDEDFLVRDALSVWRNAINTAVGNLRTTGPSPSGYKSDAIVRQYSKEGGSAIKELTIVGLYPSIVGDIVLDWELTDQIETFEVTFEYDYWLDNTTDSL